MVAARDLRGEELRLPSAVAEIPRGRGSRCGRRSDMPRRRRRGSRYRFRNIRVCGRGVAATHPRQLPLAFGISASAAAAAPRPIRASYLSLSEYPRLPRRRRRDPSADDLRLEGTAKFGDRPGRRRRCARAPGARRARPSGRTPRASRRTSLSSWRRRTGRARSRPRSTRARARRTRRRRSARRFFQTSRGPRGAATDTGNPRPRRPRPLDSTVWSPASARSRARSPSPCGTWGDASPLRDPRGGAATRLL